MLKLEQVEHMSRHELAMVNAAIDVGDDEMKMIMNKGFHGEKK